MQSQRRHKTLSCPDVQSQEFVTSAFSADGKLLAALGGAPDHALVVWLWDKGKVLGVSKLMQPVSRVSFNPSDSSTLGSSGSKYLKLWRNSDGQLKGWNLGMGKREQQNYLDHCWLPDEKLVACTDTGDVCIFEHGEFKHSISAAGGSSSASRPLLCVCAFSRGFIVGGAGGVLSVFERGDDKDGFMLTHTFSCAHGASLSSASAAATGAAEVAAFDITSISLTPSEEMLVCSCASSQLASFPLANIDILKPTESNFHFFGGFHHGPITGLDSCVRKPIVATCGADRTLRIWNYATKGCEQVKYFSEEPLSLSLHPNGHHVLVGFGDKLRFFNVLLDDVRQVQDFPVKACRECRFSRGGQYFAAVTGPSIHLFDTHTFEPMGILKGHSGPVKCICWLEGDLGMVSAGLDGAVYEWRLETRERVEDHVLKSCQYEAVVCGPHTKTKMAVVAAGRDGVLREILQGSMSHETHIGQWHCRTSSASSSLALPLKPPNPARARR